MAEVWPFAGTRFQTQEDKVQLGKVICPPYDDITPSQQKELHDRDQHNIVRLVAGNQAASDDDGNNRYLRAGECYRDWKSKGILTDEQRKCFYAYEQEFPNPSGEGTVKRLGFFALVKLQDFRSGKIRGHAQTNDAKKRDRLRLLRSIEVNLSSIHALFMDEDKEVFNVLEEATKKEPTDDFTDPSGVRHRLWMIHKKDPILRIHESMKPKRLYIADGHHRYETALKYRDMKREETGRRDGRQPYDFMLMFLQRAEEESLFTQPIHRILARELGMDVNVDEIIEDLGEFFNIAEFKLNFEDLDKAAHTVEEKVRANRTAKTRYVMTLPSGRSFQLSLKKDADLNEMIEEETMSPELKGMDVVLLHSYIITRGWIGNPEVELGEDDIFYRKDTKEALDLLKRRKGCVAFFMNPMPKEEILKIAENGELLPHNPVNFIPKVPCGLVLRDLNVGFG